MVSLNTSSGSSQLNVSSTQNLNLGTSETSETGDDFLKVMQGEMKKTSPEDRMLADIEEALNKGLISEEEAKKAKDLITLISASMLTSNEDDESAEDLKKQLDLVLNKIGKGHKKVGKGHHHHKPSVEQILASINKALDSKAITTDEATEAKSLLAQIPGLIQTQNTTELSAIKEKLDPIMQKVRAVEAQ